MTGSGKARSTPAPGVRIAVAGATLSDSQVAEIPRSVGPPPPADSGDTSMTTTAPNATVGRRTLRAALRRAREDAGHTQEQVAREMDWSLSKLIRIEAGIVGVSTTDLKALLDLYRIDDAEQVRSLIELAR